MSSSIGGDDPAHDLSRGEKDKKERELRREAELDRRKNLTRDSNRKIDRANEISRRKSKRAHQ